MSIKIDDDLIIINSTLESLSNRIKETQTKGMNVWTDDVSSNNGPLPILEGINSFMVPWWFFKENVEKNIDDTFILNQLKRIHGMDRSIRFSAAPYDLDEDLKKSNSSRDFIDTVTYLIANIISLKLYLQKISKTDSEFLDALLIDSLQWIYDNSLPNGGWMGLNLENIPTAERQYLSVYGTWSVGELFGDIKELESINKNKQISDLIIKYNSKIEHAQKAMINIITNFDERAPLYNLYDENGKPLEKFKNKKIIQTNSVIYTIYALEFLLSTETFKDFNSQLEILVEQLIIFLDNPNYRENFYKGITHQFYYGEDKVFVANLPDDSALPFSVKVLSNLLLIKNIEPNKLSIYEELLEKFRQFMIETLYIRDARLFGKSNKFELYLTSRCVESLSYYINAKKSIKIEPSELNLDIIEKFNEIGEYQQKILANFSSSLNMHKDTKNKIKDLSIVVEKQNEVNLQTLTDFGTKLNNLNNSVSSLVNSNIDNNKIDTMVSAMSEIQDSLKKMDDKIEKVYGKVKTLAKEIESINTERGTVAKFANNE